MLKIAGSVLILSSCLLYGFQISSELLEHSRQLAAMKEMLLMLSGEISYSRLPLAEAFLEIAGQNKEPFAGFLKAAAERLRSSEETSVGMLWRSLVEEEKERFLLSEEELELLKKTGENFGYLDSSMQLKNLELYIRQTEGMMEQFESQRRERQRISRYLSLMAGLFLIILLI